MRESLKLEKSQYTVFLLSDNVQKLIELPDQK